MIEKIGGRKFVFAIVSVACLMALVIIGKLDAGTFVAAIETIGGVYVIGNVATKVITDKKE